MSRGRPRSFDAGSALDRAMEVFWKKGFTGTSLSDLTEAMGINRPSLYAAFGDKEALFQKVLDRYMAGPGSYIVKALEAPTAREVAENLLVGAARVHTCGSAPMGCLTVQGVAAKDELAQPAGQALLAHREAVGERIVERLTRAQAEGDLPETANPLRLTQFLATVIAGMAVLAAGGATFQELSAVIQMALTAWPSSGIQSE